MLALKINHDRTVINCNEVIGTVNHIPSGSDDTVRRVSLNRGLPHATILAELGYTPVNTIETEIGLNYICVRTDRISGGLDHYINFVSLSHSKRLKIYLGDHQVGSLEFDDDGFMDIDVCDLLKPVVRKNIYRALGEATEHNHCYIVAAILQRELQKADIEPVMIDLDLDDLTSVDAVNNSDMCYIAAHIFSEFNAATFPVKQPDRGVMWVKYRKSMLCYIDGVFYRMTKMGTSENSVSLSELVRRASAEFCAGLKIIAYSRDGGPMMSATELRVDINGIPSAYFSKGPKKRSTHMLSATNRLPMHALVRPLIHKACFHWN